MAQYASNHPGGLMNSTGTNLLNEGETVTPEGRSYDRQVIGLNPDGSPKYGGAVRGSAEVPTGHAVITSVRDAQHGTPKGMHAMTSDDIVNIAGVGEMTLRSALDAGFVRPGQVNQAPPVSPPPLPVPHHGAPLAAQAPPVATPPADL